MDSAVAATVIGVLLSVAFAAFATAFTWLRADMNARFDKVDARFDKADARFDRLEAKVDDLIMAVARGGYLTDPQLAGSTPPPPTASAPASTHQPPEIEPSSAAAAQPNRPSAAPQGSAVPPTDLGTAGQPV